MFKPVERTAREARNPATGEMKQVPARTVVKSFRKRGPDLREPSPLLDPTARPRPLPAGRGGSRSDGYRSLAVRLS